MADLSHIRVDEAAGTADCSTCGTGIGVPARFGGIPRAGMLASFVVQHAVHNRAGIAVGLTAAGNAAKAARAVLAGAEQRGQR